jgi:putative transposase
LTDGRGVPLAVAIGGANVHDQKLVIETLGRWKVRRPKPRRYRRQHLCADKGYDSRAVRATALKHRYVVHIPRIGEPAKRRPRRAARARRWVVERTHSWTNRARRLLTRWEKKAANYLGFVHLQYGLTALRVAGVLG